MNEETAPAGGLSDDEINDMTRMHGTGGWMTLTDCRGYTRDIITADRALRASPVNELTGPLWQFRKVGCSDWYDGLPDPEDGKGPYETRKLYAQAALAAKDARIAKLESKLEVDPSHSYDGIDCRNATIKAQDEQIDALTAERDALRKDAVRWDAWRSALSELSGDPDKEPELFRLLQELPDGGLQTRTPEEIDSDVDSIIAAMTKEA